MIGTINAYNVGMTRHRAAVQFRGETFTGATHDDATARLARRFPRYRETSRKAEPIAHGRKSPEGEFVGGNKLKKAMLVFGLGIALVIALPLARAEPQWAPYPGILHGTVIQALKEGVLVDGVFTTGAKDSNGNDTHAAPIRIEATFWVRMEGQEYDKQLFGGDTVGIRATPDGSFTYTTALGASSTVRAVRFTD
jgi:hypothetical protein